MNIDELRLKNFGNHRDLVVKFRKGEITGIVGSNGAGKSTIVQSLKFVMTGESGNPGAKIDDLNWVAAAANEGGSVECLFTKNGEQGTIKRAIQRATASLAWGTVKERSVSSVNTAMMEILGVSPKTLEDIVFVMQGSIEKVLFDRPAERKKNFHALFGIDKAEDIRELLRKELASFGAAPSDERIAELERRLKVEIDPQLKDLVAKQQATQAQMQGLDRATFQKTISQFEEVQQLEQQIGTCRASVDTLQHEVSQLLSQRTEVTGRLDASTKVVEARRAEVEDLRAKVAVIDSSKKLHDTIVQLQADKQKAETTLAEPPPTTPATTQEQIAEADKQLQAARDDIAPQRAFVDAFAGAPDTVTMTCPTCGQLVENANERVAKMRANIAEQQQKIIAVKTAVDKAAVELRKYETEKQRYETRTANAKLAIEEIESKLANLGPDQYTDDAASLMQQSQATIAEFEKAEAEHKQLAALAPQFEVSIASKSGQIKTLEAQLADLHTKLSASPSESSYQTAHQMIQQLDTWNADIASFGGQISQLQQHRANTLNELERLKEQASGMAASKKYQDMCERARTLFHHDALPQVATQAFLVSLNDHLNKYLQTFQVPFGCTIAEDLSVMCSFPGVGMRTAARLSGGQKVVLGIAFRFAIYDMFAADLGFMVLDEPTNMLDQDRVAYVVEVLESVRRHAHNTGMQLIVITHEPELMQAVDQVVSL